MKKLLSFLPQAALLAALILPALGRAQSYSIDWYKIAGGGSTSTNGQYSLIGTIGQPDASGAMSGNGYSVTGGFWGLINVIQTPGLPNLIIVPSGPNSVKILWPDPATNSYTLQQTANLAAGNGAWTVSGYAITSANGTNFVTITPPVGNLFFRLAHCTHSRILAPHRGKEIHSVPVVFRSSLCGGQNSAFPEVVNSQNWIGRGFGVQVQRRHCTFLDRACDRFICSFHRQTACNMIGWMTRRTLPLKSLEGHQVRIYDPGHDMTSPLPPLLAGKTLVPDISVPAENCSILIVAPR